MNEQELKEWFFELYNSCYVVKHDDYTHIEYLYYDENFVRSKKLSNILDTEIVYTEKIAGKCLFILQYEYDYVWLVYDDIWLVIQEKLTINYSETKKLISNWLSINNKTKTLIPVTDCEISKYFYNTILRESEKLKIIKQ